MTPGPGSGQALQECLLSSRTHPQSPWEVRGEEGKLQTEALGQITISTNRYQGGNETTGTNDFFSTLFSGIAPSAYNICDLNSSLLVPLKTSLGCILHMLVWSILAIFLREDESALHPLTISDRYSSNTRGAGDYWVTCRCLHSIKWIPSNFSLVRSSLNVTTLNSSWKFILLSHEQRQLYNGWVHNFNT